MRYELIDDKWTAIKVDEPIPWVDPNYNSGKAYMQQDRLGSTTADTSSRARSRRSTPACPPTPAATPTCFTGRWVTGRAAPFAHGPRHDEGHRGPRSVSVCGVSFGEC